MPRLRKIGKNWESKSRVYAPRFHSVDDWGNIGFKKSSLSQGYLPRFHPVDKWILKVEF